MKRLFIVIVLLLVLTIVYGVVKNTLRSRINNKTGDKVNTHQQNNATAQEYVVSKLTAAHFSQELAERIYQCNELVFSSWYEYDRNRLDTQLGAFSSLGSHSDVQNRLLKRPELATLAASVAKTGIENARNLLDSLPNTSEEDVNVVLSLYTLYATPEEAIQLSKILNRGDNKKYIVELTKQNVYDMSFISVFELLESTYETNPEVAPIYQKWLYSELNQMMKTHPNTDGYDNYYLIILAQSGPIIESLKTSAHFRDNFLTFYWPKYEQLLNSIPRDENYEPKLLNYISSNNIWKFWIAYPHDAYSLLKIYGEMAPELLMKPAFLGNEPQQKAAQKALITFMTTADDESRKSLYYIPYNSDSDKSNSDNSEKKDFNTLFVEFLARDIDKTYIQKGINALANAEALNSGTSAYNELKYWSTLPDKTLLKDDSFRSDKFSIISLLPGYDIGVLICKYIDGRRVSNTDLVMAGLDGAFIAVDTIAIITALPSGGGSVVAVEGMKNGAKGSAKAGAKVVSGVAAQNITRMATKTLTKDALKTAAEKRTILSSIKAARKTLRNEGIKLAESFSKLGKVDITNQLRRLFTNSSMKCSTFKKWSGLDARIFMRSDRRVFFDFKPFLQKSGMVIAEDVAIGTAAYFALTSKPGQEVVNAITSKIRSISAKTSESDIWKSDMSAWWMANQYGESLTNASSDNSSQSDSSQEQKK